MTTTAYDDQQRATSVTYPDPDGAGALSSPVVSTVYNSANWVTSTTDPRGGVTSYTFDNLGRVLTQTDPDPDGSGALSAPVTTNVYNGAGLYQVIDPMNHTTTLARDGKGRVTSVTDPGGNVTDYEYDYYDNLTKETKPDPDGAGSLTRPITSYSYDSVDRLKSKTDPLGGITNYTYDNASNLISLTDPVSNTTNFGYDALNRLVLNTNSLSKSKSYVYDVAGNLTRTVDRNGRVVQYEYDALDRQIAEKWQSSTTVPSLTVATTQDGGTLDEQQSVGWTSSAYSLSGTFTLTQNGQTTAGIAWNASAATIQTALEGLSSVGSGNVLVSVSSPSTYSRTISLTYRNSKGGTNMAQTTINISGLSYYPTAPSSFATTSVTGGTYTEIQTIALANGSGGTWRLAYNGEVSAPLSPTINAATVESTLEAFNGIDNVTVTGSSGSFTVTFAGTQSSTNMGQIFGDAANVTNGSTSRTISTTYNVASEITALSDPSATISYTRDNLGRATSIANTVTGLTPTVTLNQTFDAMNNRTQLKAAIGSGNDFKNSYTYDALQRLTEVIQQGQSGGNTVQSKRVAFAYNALGQYTQLARFQSTSTSNAVAKSDFTYDTVNRLSTLAHKQSSTTLSDYTYTYDADSRITNVTSSAEGSSTYSYDTSSQVTGADHTSQTDETYGFDANGNRNTTGYTTATNNQATASPGYTYTYDDEGNRTRRTETSNSHVQEYAWDHRNRLTQVAERNSVGGAITKQVDYEYDEYNRLVKRTYDSDGAGASGSTSQYWIYDDGINAILQFDGAAASNLAHRYLWSNQVDALLADEQVTFLGSAGNALWGLGDHLGTLRDIADFNESTSVTTVANHRKYNAFGKLTSESNSAVDLLFGFTGKQLDEATGLQHNLFRWYDSVLGQWMNEDPLSFGAGDENVRRYVGNASVFLTDPSGLVEDDFDRFIPPTRCTGEWPERTHYIPPPPRPRYQPPMQNFPFDTVPQVAVYDWYDDGENNPRNANGWTFYNTASTFQYSLYARNWERLMDSLDNFSERYGRIGELHIFDHGYTYTSPESGHVYRYQSYGNRWLAPEDYGHLRDVMAEYGVIYLHGCEVGRDPDYVQQVANYTRLRVFASPDIVRYSREFGQYDYYSYVPYQEFKPQNNP